MMAGMTPENQFSQFLKLCMPYLEKKKSTDLVKLLQKRFNDCSEAYKLSGEFYDLTEITAAKIESDSKHIFIYLRDYQSELKSNQKDRKRKREETLTERYETPSPKSLKWESTDCDSDDNYTNRSSSSNTEITTSVQRNELVTEVQKEEVCITIDDSSDDEEIKATPGALANMSQGKSPVMCKKQSLVKTNGVDNLSSHRSKLKLPQSTNLPPYKCTLKQSGFSKSNNCFSEISNVSDSTSTADPAIPNVNSPKNIFNSVNGVCSPNRTKCGKILPKQQVIVGPDNNAQKNPTKQHLVDTIVVDDDEEENDVVNEENNQCENKDFSTNLDLKNINKNHTVSQNDISVEAYKDLNQAENMDSSVSVVDLSDKDTATCIKEDNDVNQVTNNGFPYKNEVTRFVKDVDDSVELCSAITESEGANLTSKELDSIVAETNEWDQKESSDLLNKDYSSPVNKETSGPVNKETSGPVNKETSGPVNKEETSGPVKEEEISGPVIQEETPGSLNKKETPVPVNKEETSGPVHQEETLSPVNHEENSGPFNQEENSGPFNQEENSGSVNHGEISGPVNQEETSDTVNQEEKSKTGSKRQIARLEKLLEDLRNKIEELKEKELSVDELDDECSAYILEDKYQQKFVKVWNKLCELKNKTSSTGRPLERRFKYTGTRYPEINKKIEKFVNKRKQFPDYHDVHAIITKVNNDKKIGLGTSAIDRLSREAFLDVGEALQKRRRQDLMVTSAGHTKERPTEDPALHDPELKKKLANNRKHYRDMMDQVLNKYAEEQLKTGDEEGEDIGDQSEEEDQEVTQKDDNVPELTTILEDRGSPVLENPQEIAQNLLKSSQTMSKMNNGSKDLRLSNFENSEDVNITIETDSFVIETDNAESLSDSHVSETTECSVMTSEKTSGDEWAAGSPAVLMEIDEEECNESVIDNTTVCFIEGTWHHSTSMVQDVEDDAPVLYTAVKIDENEDSSNHCNELPRKHSVRVLLGDDDLFEMSGIEEMSDSGDSNSCIDVSKIIDKLSSPGQIENVSNSDQTMENAVSKSRISCEKSSEDNQKFTKIFSNIMSQTAKNKIKSCLNFPNSSKTELEEQKRQQNQFDLLNSVTESCDSNNLAASTTSAVTGPCSTSYSNSDNNNSQSEGDGKNNTQSVESTESLRDSEGIMELSIGGSSRSSSVSDSENVARKDLIADKKVTDLFCQSLSPNESEKSHKSGSRTFLKIIDVSSIGLDEYNSDDSVAEMKSTKELPKTKSDIKTAEIKSTKELPKTKFDIKTVEMKSTKELLKTKSDIKTAEMKSTKELPKTKSDIKIAEMKSTKELPKTKSDIKTAEMRSTKELLKTKSDIKTVEMKSTKELLKTKSDIKTAEMSSTKELLKTRADINPAKMKSTKELPKTKSDIKATTCSKFSSLFHKGGDKIVSYLSGKGRQHHDRSCDIAPLTVDENPIEYVCVEDSAGQQIENAKNSSDNELLDSASKNKNVESKLLHKDQWNCSLIEKSLSKVKASLLSKKDLNKSTDNDSEDEIQVVWEEKLEKNSSTDSDDVIVLSDDD